MSEPKCIEALHMQKELDADGVFVGVSRQAIDETVAYVAALRAQVERLEAEKLRLREVVKSVEHSERVNPLNGQRYNSCPSCWQAEPQHFTDCQLAAVLRETEANTETGRK